LSLSSNLVGKLHYLLHELHFHLDKEMGNNLKAVLLINFYYFDDYDDGELLIIMVDLFFDVD